MVLNLPKKKDLNSTFFSTIVNLYIIFLNNAKKYKGFIERLKKYFKYFKNPNKFKNNTI